jgi:SAM-dependent methyltransferase
LAAQVWRALGSARVVINVGAGTGSYEPSDRVVVAVEPSEVMIAQRSPQAAPVVRATAESLPFADNTADAAMAVLTIHHWDDLARGVGEMVRVARRRIVVVTMDLDVARDLWIFRDYLGKVLAGHGRRFPAISDLVELVPGAQATPLLVPSDCSDGFMVAYWARPEAYLDPQLRRAASPWLETDPWLTDRALTRLANDVRTGAWDRRHGRLRETALLDVGLRLVIADLPPR